MRADTVAALRFLQAAFEPTDWIALFLKSCETGRSAQRVGPLSLFLRPRVHAWLRAMNAKRYGCYVGVNAIKPGLRSRTRDAIGAVRHLFLETDNDGPQLLEAIRRRDDLPPPSYLIESSPNRLHVLWRVSGFTTMAVERLQKHLARELGTDSAATSCSQSTRIPGYRNPKYRPAPLVTVQYCASRTRYAPRDFPLPPPTPPAPAAAPAPRLNARGSMDVVERARRYLARVEPAVAGQHGDLHTFRVSCRIVRDFALPQEAAFTVLAEWNARCVPPWSERELRVKINAALRYGREELGTLTSGKCSQHPRRAR